MTFNPSPEQAAYFEWLRSGSGNAIIEAVAGSGKTTTIVAGLDLLPRSASVKLLAYNKRMAVELVERIPNGKEVASTFHAAGFAALRATIRNCKTDGDKLYLMVKEDAEAKPHLKPLLGSIPAMVSVFKQKGVIALQPYDENAAEDWLYHYGINSKLPEDVSNEDFLDLALQYLKKSNNLIMKSGKIDFDDMLYAPLLLGSRFGKPDYLLVDEAQDTNRMRREIMHRMAGENTRVIAVGDPHQAIFGFTGADATGFQLIADEFKCQRFPLTVSYRCPQKIVAHAQHWVSHIQAHASAPEGELRECDEADFLSQVAPGDAVLCRFNRPLFKFCFALIRRGQGAKIEGRAIGDGLIVLARKWKVHTLDSLKSRLATYFAREKEKANGRKSILSTIEDREETMSILIEHVEETGGTTPEDLVAFIKDLFADDVTSNPKLVIFSSIHRAKGLEWPRVWLLGRKQLMPSRFATLDHELEQEMNLIYVAVTRAKQELIEVNLES